MKSFKHKLDLACNALSGDEWVHVKDGHKVRVEGHTAPHKDIILFHIESKRKTTKKPHYFAYEYEPIA